jgi:hypothetical protein
MTVEGTFGELIQRWGVLCRPLRVRETNGTLLLSALAKLHNLCIERPITTAGWRSRLEHAERPARLELRVLHGWRWQPDSRPAAELGRHSATAARGDG